jgi:predicted ATPase
MKIAFTGTHGTGKTTAAYEWAVQCKKDYPDKSVGIILEVARHSPLPINQNATLESEVWIFSEQIRKEIEYQSRYDIVVCDRTMFDAIAYAKIAGFPQTAEKMFEYASMLAHTYDEIIFKHTKNNNYLIHDGVRDMDKQFRINIEDTLLEYFNRMVKQGISFNFQID